MTKFSKGGDINSNNMENSKIIIVFAMIIPIILYFLSKEKNIFISNTYFYSFIILSIFTSLLCVILFTGDNKQYFLIYLSLILSIFILIYLYSTLKPWKWTLSAFLPNFIKNQMMQTSIPLFLDFEYLHKEKNIANTSNIPQLEYNEPTTDIFTYVPNKNYSISLWIYLNQQTHKLKNQKNINIFHYGDLEDMKPGISYNNNYKKTENKDIYTITFNGTSDNDENNYDIELTSQKWNNFVFNYSNNSVDLFINGNLERTFMFNNIFPNYLPTDLFTIGDTNGLNGAIGNIRYYIHPLMNFQIANTYNLLMDKNPPRNNIL